LRQEAAEPAAFHASETRSGLRFVPVSRALRSLYYPAFYLTAAGLALVLAPDFALKLFFSTGHYGDVMPRMAGATTLALGILVVQIIRHRVEGLYATLVGARVMLCTVWMSLFLYTRDPFFLIVFGMVAVGMVWTAVGLALDRRTVSHDSAPCPSGGRG
jgi:uncharacterized protein YjeT (DUF2065 family)